MTEKNRFDQELLHYVHITTNDKFLLGEVDYKEVDVWDLNTRELINVIEHPDYDSIPIHYGEEVLIMMGESKIFTMEKNGRITTIVSENSFLDAAVAPDQSFLVYCTSSHPASIAYVYEFRNSRKFLLGVYHSLCCIISSDSKYIAIGVIGGFSLFKSDHRDLILFRHISGSVVCLDFEKSTNNVLVCTGYDLEIITHSDELLIRIQISLDHPPKWLRFSGEHVCLLTHLNELIVCDAKSGKNISNDIMLRSAWALSCLDNKRNVMISKVENFLVFNRYWKNQGNSKRFYLLLNFQKRIHLH